MKSTKIFFNQFVNNIRIYLIRKLIGKKFKVVSNIKITSDILEYNKGVDIKINVRVKQVSSQQSFVYSPNVTKVCY